MFDEKIIKLQHFFEVDLRIKKEMYRLAPSSLKYYDEGSMTKYTDDLNDAIMYIFTEFKCVAADIFGLESQIMSKITEMENIIKNNFYSCGYDIDKLRLFYKNFISNMELDFINAVKEECVGYTLGGISSVKNAKTINEILHFMHSFIINNEQILQSIPLIDKKENDYNYSISLRGVKVPAFEQLLALFPNDLDVGWTDMVAINERKLLMMVRDRGHALSVEITIKNDLARLEYFIPKLCNVRMINSLPGINKVNEDSVGATGVFEVNVNELPHVLYDFISRVPTDSDMVFESLKGR